MKDNSASKDKKVDVWQVKKYDCKVKILDLVSGKNIISLNKSEAQAHDIYWGFRTQIMHKGKPIVGVVDVSDEIVKPGEIGVYRDFADRYKIKKGETVEIVHMDQPASISYIKKKLEKRNLSDSEIKTVVKEIMEDKLGEIETSAWITAAYINGLSDDEIISLTHATVESGEQLNLGKHPIVDKHCLSGDVPVMVKNSGNTKVRGIGEIIDAVFDRCSPDEIKNDDGAEFTSSNLRNLHVPSFDENGNVIYEKITGVFRAPAPKILHEITLRGNRKIKTTSDHTIFTLNNGIIVNIPARDLKAGDYVVVPSGVNSKTNSESIEYKGMKIKITPEFMRLLGYYVSEGFTNYQGVFFNFGSHEKELIKDCSLCVKTCFGKTATINKPHKTATRVTVYSHDIKDFFNEKIKAGESALEKTIPSFIFDLEREMILEFVRALFEGDGYVRRGYEAIYVTSSKKLANSILYLLSSNGISVNLSESAAGPRQFPDRISYTHKAYYIYTQARELYGGRKKANVSFLNLLPTKHLGSLNKKAVGWKQRRKFKQKYITKDGLRKMSTAIGSKDIHKILNGNLGVLEVKTVATVPSETKYVYDFQLKTNHRFMAGSAPMFVHNCIGGVAGNRTTMILVPIIAAAGVYIPKTSSRSITSAAGTADTMEVLADVTFGMDELRSIVKKAKGAVVWGGGMQLAPVDDKLIKIRHPLSLDPEGMLLASILGKKKSVGAEYVLIDIPVGRGVKVPYVERGNELAKHFLSVGEKLGLKIEALITDGSEPVGNGIGPALECIDVLQVLEGDGPEELRQKALLMSGKLLELCGKASTGNGFAAAEILINNGKALSKFKEIIELQGGNPKVKSTDMRVGHYSHTITSSVGGSIFHIDNKVVSKIARIAGSPRDKGAGVLLHRQRGDRVEIGDKLFTIFAESEAQLDFALRALKDLEPIEMRKMLLGSMR